MLQAINDQHDRGFGNSLTELTAAREDGRIHLLLACSGSVATIKLPEIIKAFAPYEGRLSIRVVLTEPAKRFLAGQSDEQPTFHSLTRLPCVDAVYDDSCEWGPEPWVRGDAVLHIELRRWADLMVVAPMSANTLAAVVSGMSSSLLLSCIRAWDTDGSIDGKRKRIIVALAMNTAMWRHPITTSQIRQLEEDWGVKDPVSNGKDGDGIVEQESGWFEVIRPISKTLACGDVGDGAMASVETIVKTIEARLGLNKSLR